MINRVVVRIAAERIMNGGINPKTNETLEIVQLVGDIRDTHYKLSDDSVIGFIDFITKPIYLIKAEDKND